MNINKIKFLQIGLGSMGRRRIRALLYNKIPKENIYGFDISKKRCGQVGDEYKIETFSDFEQAVKSVNPQAFIISTPPNQHAQYFLYAAKNKIHFFEDTAAHNDGYKELLPLLDNTFVAAPCCTFRFFPAVKKIKEIIDKGVIGKIQSFNFQDGQYLPDWHPWEDYRWLYLAKKKTGACRGSLIFNLAWITDIFGSSIKKINGLAEKVSELDMKAEDIFLANIKFKNNILGNIAIDSISRQPYTTLRLLGSEGTLDWEREERKIDIFKIKGRNPKPGTPLIKKTIRIKKGVIEKGYTINTEEMYQEEMKKFIEAIKGKIKFPFTFKDNKNNIESVLDFLGKLADC